MGCEAALNNAFGRSRAAVDQFDTRKTVLPRRLATAEVESAVGSATRLATPGWDSAPDRWSIELTGGASELSVTEL